MEGIILNFEIPDPIRGKIVWIWTRIGEDIDHFSKRPATSTP